MDGYLWQPVEAIANSSMPINRDVSLFPANPTTIWLRER